MSKIKVLFVLVGCLLFTHVNTVFASELTLPSNVQVLGEAQGLVSFQGDGPFLTNMAMFPGDRVEQLLIIHNDHDYASELFLRAERVSEEEEFDLLSKLELMIYHDGEIIYKGPACGSAGMEENISLGVFEPGDHTLLYASIELDGPSTGNEYQNKYAEVHWVFTATHAEQSENKPDVKPEAPSTTNKPSSSSPTTGYAMSGIALVVAAGCIGVGVRNYVKDEKDKR